MITPPLKTGKGKKKKTAVNYHRTTKLLSFFIQLRMLHSQAHVMGSAEKFIFRFWGLKVWVPVEKKCNNINIYILGNLGLNCKILYNNVHLWNIKWSCDSETQGLLELNWPERADLIYSPGLETQKLRSSHFIQTQISLALISWHKTMRRMCSAEPQPVSMTGTR